MKVKIVMNKGNPYYDQFIDQIYEASYLSGDNYLIKDIKTMTSIIKSDKNSKSPYSKFTIYASTWWLKEELEFLPEEN